MKHLLYFLFNLVIISVAYTQQTDSLRINLKASGYLNSGYEHNLFYSPESLRLSNGNMLNKDSLIRSGGFAKGGINFSFNLQKGKKTFAIRSNNYYKNYFSKSLQKFDNMNIDLTPAFQYNFKKSDYFMIQSTFAKKKMTRALTMDDETIIPLSHLRVNPRAAYQRLLFKKISARIDVGYDYRKYTPGGEDKVDFTFGEISSALSLKYLQRTKKSALIYKINYAFSHRTYFNWSSKIDTSNLENLNEEESFEIDRNIWAYHNGGLNISAKLNPKLRAGVSLGVTKKIDLAKTGFGFDEMQIGANISYRLKKFTFSLRSGYSMRKYTTRRILVPNEQQGALLAYKYLNTGLRVDYKIYKGLNANVNFLSRLRQTNSTNVSRVTRRNYSHYTITGGISYTFNYKKQKAAKR